MSFQVLLLIASLMLLNAINTSARGLHAHHGHSSSGASLQRSSQLRSAGGSKSVLGRDKLRRIKRNSGFAGTIEELATKLDSTDDLVVDTSSDALVHECTGLLPPDDVVSAATALDPGVIDPTLTVQQAFSLHSRPSAKKKLLLDFDGHVAANTMYNSARLPVITVKVYDTDGNPNAWSASELSDIVAIWRAVAEDYSAFDVDVTTEDQAGGAVAYTDMMRAAIGGSWQDWYNRTAGGLCFVDTFGRADGSPCFIFPVNLGAAKFVWEATSHELGHSLGLWHAGVLAHDSQAAREYYNGQGDWAPIMGAAYGKQITQFDRGEYAYCNHNQDDYAVISRYLPLLAQTNGKDIASATPMSAAPGAATAAFVSSGLITQQGVPEVFSFSLPAAPAGSAAPVAACSLDLVVPVPFRSYNRANLNAVLTVMDAAGAIVATFDPPGASPNNGLGVAGASVTLPVAAAGGPGTLFYVSVAGAGAGNPQADGFSSYGSRGQYELSVACGLSPATPSSSPSPSPSPSPLPSPSPDPSPSPLPSPDPSPSPSPDPIPTSPPPTEERSQPLPAAISFSLKKTRTTSGFTCTVTVRVTDATTGTAITSALVQGSWYAPATKYTSSITGKTAGGRLQASIARLPLSRSSCRAFIARIALPPGYVAASSSSGTFDRRLSW